MITRTVMMRFLPQQKIEGCCCYETDPACTGTKWTYPACIKTDFTTGAWFKTESPIRFLAVTSFLGKYPTFFNNYLLFSTAYIKYIQIHEFCCGHNRLWFVVFSVVWIPYVIFVNSTTCSPSAT